MKFREATTSDIEALHVIRLAVKENILSTPSLVTEDDYLKYLTTHGKGWLCEINNEIAGFAIIDTEKNNIWALFVHPNHECKRIGKQLQDIMLNWFFAQSNQELWLTTGINTRAEAFYNKTGWQPGDIIKGQRKFTMSFDQWNIKQKQKAFTSKA
jgi:GNAT superfamily N-acetyltransferase